MSKESAASLGKGSSEPLYRQFQLAHEAYFTEICAAWNDLQRRNNDLQFEYNRSYLQASQSQFQRDFSANQKEFQAINEKFQRAFQSVASDPAPRKRFPDAYVKYKESIKKAMADLNIDKVDPATLAAIGQSMNCVAQTAAQVDSPLFLGIPPVATSESTTQKA